MQLQQIIKHFTQERDFITAILDPIGALVIVLDQQGRIVCFNSACEQITKYSFAEVENKFFWEIFSLTKEIKLAKLEFNQLNIKQIPKTSERYLLTKDGKQLENISLPRKILDRMIESGERQLHLINSLLETHISEAQGISLHFEPVKISELVKSITEDLEPLFLKTRATIHNLFLDDFPLVNADNLQLRRVFENLISNALNHNSPGLQITLQASLEGEMIRCLVQDNGVGMNEEQCLKIFERYSRGDRLRRGVAHRSPFTGIGLGLYLCRQIITAHGGEIGVYSSPGKGATFWFTLPIS